MLDIPFREEQVPLFRPDTQERILSYSRAGRVPVLIDGELTVHDSFAIMEYANEVYADGKLLPADRAMRARARSVCAEMHGGFANLRENLPMNLGREPAPYAVNGETTQEISRILDMWEGLLLENEGAGPYLFGQWSMADCMYLPVATRFRAYGVDMGRHGRAAAYVDALHALPAFQEWRGAALDEALLPHYEL